MNPELLYSVFKNTLNNINDVRKQAEEQLIECEKQQGFVKLIFQIAIHNECELVIRQAAAVRMKNKVGVRDWNTSPLIGEDEKELLRSQIVGAMVYLPEKVQRQFLKTVEYMLSWDYPERWQSCASQTLELLTDTSNMQKVSAGVSIIGRICKYYAFRSSAERQPLHELLQRCMEYLTNLFTHLVSLPPDNTVAHLQKLLLKIWYSSTASKVPTFIMNNLPLYDKWMQLMLQVLRTEVPASETNFQVPLWKAKKWVLHFATRLLQMYGYLGRESEDQNERLMNQQFQAKCAKHYSSPFLEASLFVLNWKASGKYVSHQIVSLTLTVLSACIDMKHTYEVLSSDAVWGPLLDGVLIPIMSHNDDDARLWDDDETEYCRRLDDINDMFVERSACAQVLQKMTWPMKKYHKKTMLNTVAIRVKTVLEQCEQVKSTGSFPEADARRKDGMLAVVGVLRRAMKTTEPYNSQIEALLNQFVFPELVSPYRFLREKAVWVAGQYSKLEWKNLDSFKAAFLHACALLKDKEMPVRTRAAVSLQPFLKNKKVGEIVIDKLGSIVEDLFRIMDEAMESDTIIQSMEKIISLYGEHLSGFTRQLLEKLINHFVNVVPKDDLPEDAEDENLDQNFQQQLAAAACLRAVCQLLAAVKNKPDAYRAIHDLMIQLLALLFSETNVEYIDETMEMAARYTFFCPELPAEVWSLFPKIYQAITVYAIDYAEDMIGVLDNLVTRGTQMLLDGVCPDNGRKYIQMYMDLFQIVLFNELYKEAWSVPPKLMSCILQHSRQYQDKLNPYVPGMYGMVLQKFQSMGTEGGRAMEILCLNVLLDGMYYNASLTYNYLKEANVLGAAVQKLLANIPERKRYFDKKVAVMGFASLVHHIAEAKCTDLSDELLAQIIGACFKLIILSHEQLLRQDDEDDSDGEEDEEDSDADDIDDVEDSDDEDDDEEEVQEVGKKKLSQIIREAQESGDLEDLDDDGDEYDPALDDEDAFSSVIEQASEAELFATVVQSLQSAAPQMFQFISSNVAEDTKAKFGEAVTYINNRCAKIQQKEEEHRRKQQ